MREDARRLVLTALPLVARRMEKHNECVPVSDLGEIAHLRPALEEALEAAAVELCLPALVRREHPFQCVEWESRAGVDVAVRGLPKLAPVFCELKWGDGASVLGECSWDLAKMGLAVAKQACSAAVLIAGAPCRRWTQPGLEGAELFMSERRGLAHLRGPLYLHKYWMAYALEGLPEPRKLPSGFETFAIASEELTLDGERWELRCVEVSPVGELVPVEQLPGAV